MEWGPRAKIWTPVRISNILSINVISCLLKTPKIPLCCPHAIFSGGCTRNGSLLFTFTDNCNNKEIRVENYRKAIDYFCNIPSESDKQTGFSILIDRRNDKWSSVKNVLILIQDYFPAKLNTIFILRPQSYFQRVLSSILFQEDTLNESANLNNYNQAIKNHQFNIKICKNLDELYESIDKENLTTEFGGTIHYRHQEWIEQRQFIEKLSTNVNECVASLKQFIKFMEETDFPNDVTSTQLLINTQLKERADLLSSVQSTKRFGETVLNLIEKTSKIDMFQNKTEKYSALTPDIRIHYQTVFNLLQLMEESQKTLEMFWNNHFIRLNKCLDLRKFEQQFKDVRINILKINEKLASISDENIQLEEEYDSFIRLLQVLNEQSKSAFEEAFNLYNQGIELLISSKKNIKTQLDDTEKSYIDSGVESSSNDFNSISDLKNFGQNFAALDTNNNSEMVFLKQETSTGYCIDSVEPKCSELKRLIDEFKSSYFKKLNGLKNNKLLVQKISLVKQTLEKGTRLFHDQDLINMSHEKKRKYLNEIEEWLHDYYKMDLSKGETGSEDETVTLSSFDMDASIVAECVRNHETNVGKNFEIACSQLKSLGQMFEKRKEQLNKAFVVSRPVQRVEPQQIFDQSNLMNRIHDTFKREIRRDNKTKSFDTNCAQDISKPKRTLSNADPSQLSGFLKKNPRKFSHGTLKTRKLSNDSSSSSINDNEDDEIIEQKKLDEKKIRHILNELIETERVYVSELKLIIDGYLNTLNDPENQYLVPHFVLLNKDILFGNIQEIYNFHNKIFLKELELSRDSIPKICKLFIECE
ncbi:guanine nucleotide exchange factor DBS isoform X4 [Brachionus plicatilis]|uniref:Guanine nucleotide exchange factor DBS isoform X4 n=1 Tax=Brachionus plicatilis TaxID=10195 RepID=A0A3M7RJP7_BRAPC|nr:guanine nucleotide exchange factor DBS isoform X4 [Brachionus plicatilis]